MSSDFWYNITHPIKRNNPPQLIYGSFITNSMLDANLLKPGMFLTPSKTLKEPKGTGVLFYENKLYTVEKVFVDKDGEWVINLSSEKGLWQIGFGNDGGAGLFYVVNAETINKKTI
jgi:hypothetical protein